MLKIVQIKEKLQSFAFGEAAAAPTDPAWQQMAMWVAVQIAEARSAGQGEPTTGFSGQGSGMCAVQLRDGTLKLVNARDYDPQRENEVVECFVGPIKPWPLVHYEITEESAAILLLNRWRLLRAGNRYAIQDDRLVVFYCVPAYKAPLERVFAGPPSRTPTRAAEWLRTNYVPELWQASQEVQTRPSIWAVPEDEHDQVAST